MANVGYYDMTLGQGDSAQIDELTNGGHSVVDIQNLDPLELAGIDFLYVQNDDNFGFGAEYLSNLANVNNAVANGLNLIIFDRYVTDAATILPGGHSFNIIRDANNAEIQIAAGAPSEFINGPGGVITDDMFDGGNQSSHGYVERASLPPNAVALLTTGNPDQVVAFYYPEGNGLVFYSTIPLDFYSENNNSAITPAEVDTLVANVIHAMESASNGPIIGTPGDDTLTGTADADEIIGLGGADSIEGLGGNDSIDGGWGHDTINGGDGIDTVLGGGGNDHIIDTDYVSFDHHDGGAGIDTIDYSQAVFADNRVTIDLENGIVTVSNPAGNTETILNFENALGGAGAETIFGSNGDNFLAGNGGDDTLLGRSGDDEIDGGTGNDTVLGQQGEDLLFGGEGHDSVSGGTGNDTIDGGIGDDILSGDADRDWLFGGAGDDTLDGGNGKDWLVGEDGNDLLLGGNNKDSLDGGRGNDTLVGGEGNDRLFGGFGDDVFRYLDVSDSGLGGSARDKILDFGLGNDMFDLSAIDANVLVGGNQDFTFIGANGYSGTAGELRYTQGAFATILRGDVNGDGVDDFQIQIVGQHALDGSDFV